MVPLNMTYLHCLQHSLFEHLFNLYCSGTSITTVKQTLETDSINLIKWFDDNKMKANLDKFQAISIGNKTHKACITFQLDGNTIVCEEEIILLGVTIDFNLNFIAHNQRYARKPLGS